MRYLIVDDEYRVYCSDVFSGRMRAALKRGRLTVVDVKRMQGMNIDGWTWEDVQPIANYFESSDSNVVE